MIKQISIFVVLIFTLAANATNLTEEMTKLVATSKRYKKTCSSFAAEYERIGAIDKESGRLFTSKVKALKAFEMLSKKDPGIPMNSVKAYQLLVTEEKWPKDKTFMKNIGALNNECAIFEKHHFFTAYALSHDKMGFNGIDHKKIMDFFNKYIFEGLKSPTTLINIMIRSKDLTQFTKLQFIGKKEDISRAMALTLEMEKELQNHKRNLSSKEYGEWALKHELRLTQEYVKKLKSLYTSLN